MCAKILTIETSTECCSAALCEGMQVLAQRSSDASKVHASMLAPFVEQVLSEASVKTEELAAVAVSEGPGSYTGLRVGVSTAKGICFGLGIPLIAIDTLKILAIEGCNHQCKPVTIIPFIDARRMEVYAARFDGMCNKLSDTEAIILDENSFAEELVKGPVLFIGTGVEKFKSICKHPNANFVSSYPMAGAMAKPAALAYAAGEFKDTAYFEPFYLKEFMIGISKKSILDL